MDARPPVTIAWQNLRAEQDTGVWVHRVRDHGDINDHDHLFHEIVFVESGTADHEADDGRRRLRPGDLIVIRPQVWHAYRRTRALSIINCLIDSRLMHRLAGLLDHLDGAVELFRKRAPHPRRTPPLVLHASPAQRTVILQRLETMLAEQREKRNGWQAAAIASLLDILVITSRLSRKINPAPTEPLSDRTEQAVSDVATHLEANLASPIRLGELAQRANLSPAHLCRSFSRRMGMGLVQFLHRARAEEACRLLRCTDLPVARIASRLGYNEIAYFSRCFRAQIGQSPRQYRRGFHDDVIKNHHG